MWNNSFMMWNICLFCMCKKYTYKICLYTGIETFDEFKNNYENLLPYIDYLKVGHYDEEAGALDKVTTNQRFYVLNQSVPLRREPHRRRK